MSKCVIFCAGQKVLKSCISSVELEECYVISADKGYLLAKEFGCMSDIIVGDFDSLGYAPDEDTEIITYPVEKDDTDLMLAVKIGLEKGYNEFIILGAMGGRFDHTVGNIQTLAYILNHGGVGKIISDSEVITLVNPGEYVFDKKENYTLSLVSYSEKVSGLSISGTKYPLENGEIDNGFPLGISNMITQETACISFMQGQLLIIQSDLFTKF